MLSAKLPKYGFHSSTADGYFAAIDILEMFKATAVQIWVGNNKSYNYKEIPSEKYEVVAELVKERDIFLIAHSPYILNFARPLQDAPGQKALNRYLNDLINIKNLGGVGSILHMPSNVKELKQSTTDAYKMLVRNLEWIIERKPRDVYIILENMAGGGAQICAKMADWGDFWQNHVPKSVKRHVRWCVDTAHLYAAGEYDLSKRSEALRFYKEFDENIGWNYLLCFHFNGSKSAFGSNHDKHADIGVEKCGQILTKGMRQLARIAGATDKPIIMEVPCDEIELVMQCAIINSWHTAFF